MSGLKILMLNYEFPPIGGGAAPVTLQLCRQLVSKGHEVDVVTMRYKDLPVFEQIDGVNVYRTWAIRKRANICHTHEMASYLAGAFWKAMSLSRDKKYDIIHSHFIIPTGPLAMTISKMTGIPYIVTSHGSDVPGFNPDRFGNQHKFTKPILRAVCGNAKAITSPSLYLGGLIRDNIGDYKITHIPNGIDVEEFRFDADAVKENIILATGRLLKRKGFQTIIRAVRDIEFGFEVHICGDGPYRQELERLADGSKTKIIFHGWLERGSRQLAELYEKASVYCLVSSHENASVALLEGMAAKCAVITTKVTGCPETVGESGFLIDFEDWEELREIFIKLSKDRELLHRYGQQAYERVQEKFMWKDIAESYIKLYAGVVNNEL